MQSKQMAECLQQLAPLLRSEGREVLLGMSDALRAEEGKSFASVAAKLLKRLHDLAPQPNESSVLLDRMAEVARAAGSGPVSKDFITAARILERLGTIDPIRIAAEVANALAPPAKTVKPVKVPRPDPREAADQLTITATDSTRFEALIAELSKLSKQNLAEIADRFLGYSRPYKSKAEVLKAIRSRQFQDALDASRQERVAKTSV